MRMDHPLTAEYAQAQLTWSQREHMYVTFTLFTL